MSARPVVSGGWTSAETATFEAAARSLAAASDALGRCLARVGVARSTLDAGASGVVGWGSGRSLDGGSAAPQHGFGSDPGELWGPGWGAAARAATLAAADDAARVRADVGAARTAVDALRVAVLRAGHLYADADAGASAALRTARAAVAVGVGLVGAVSRSSLGPLLGPAGTAGRWLADEADAHLPGWTGAATVAEGVGPLVPAAVDGLAGSVAGEAAWLRFVTGDPAGAERELHGPVVERQAGRLAGVVGAAADRVAGSGLDVRQVTTAPDGTPLPTIAAPGTVEQALRQVPLARAPGPGSVAVQRLGTGDSARYVVTVPGTEQWAPFGSLDFSDPLDLRSDLELVAGQPNAVVDEVAAAMAGAGIPADAPVVVVGHSLGGIAAARVVSDPALRSRYTFAAVVTAGSPVGRIDVPASTLALHVENPKEGVSGTDGAPNPATPTRVTVSAGLDDDVVAASGRDGAKGPHDVATHADVLAEARAEGDPALDRVLDRVDALLGDDGEPTQTWYFQGRRVPDATDVPTPEPGPPPSPVPDARPGPVLLGTVAPLPAGPSGAWPPGSRP